MGVTINSSVTGSTVTVNGATVAIPPGAHSVSVRDGVITVDGVVLNGPDGTPLAAPSVELVVRGTPLAVTTDRSVTVHGGVQGDVRAGGSVNCDGVGGSVTAGGSVRCDDVRGSVTASGSVSCDDVGGSVKAGGSVRRG